MICLSGSSKNHFDQKILNHGSLPEITYCQIFRCADQKLHLFFTLSRMARILYPGPLEATSEKIATPPEQDFFGYLISTECTRSSIFPPEERDSL